MNDDVQQLLHALKLRKMLEVVDRELKLAVKGHASYEAFLARLLREELLDRQARTILNHINQAKLPEQWALETFPFKRQPGVKPAVIKELAELDFVRQATNIVFIGPTGVGKTGLGTGLLLKALENGYRGRFIAAQNLFDEMYASLADRSTVSLLKRLVNLDVLLIDELGYLNIKPEQSNIFFKLIEERYGRKSTIITTNLTYEEWYGFLGNKQMVAALLNRLRHHCHTIEIDGPSLRQPQHPQADSTKG